MRPIVTDRVASSVGWPIGLSVTLVSPAKTAEPIDMPFGLWARVYYVGVQIPMGRGNFEGEGKGVDGPLVPKSGRCARPFYGGSRSPIKHNVAWTEAYLHTKWHLDPSNRLATIHQRHGQTDRTGQGRQRSESIGRTVLQTVAQNG